MTPISEVFKDITSNQKMSVMNLLLTVASCDVAQGNLDKEMTYLNIYRKELQVSGDKCMAYLESGGRQRLINDLKQLSQSQKEFLAVVSFEIIICDSKPNETELMFATSIFTELGLDEDKFIAIIETAMMKHLGEW